MPRNSRAEFLMLAKRLSAAYLANAASLPGLETLHQEFATVLTELEGLGVLQDAQTAAVQQTTKEIEERLTLGRILATRLRDGVKLHLGTRTEKVIEFGVRPFRKRARAPKIVEVPVLVIKEDATEKTETTETTKPTP